MKGPGWPDARGWCLIGMFALVFYVLTLMALFPGLREDELFKTLATLLLGSGAFGLAMSYVFGGSKASTAASDMVNEVVKSKAKGE